MTTTPADTLRTAAERAREIGDPLHTALAPLLEAVSYSDDDTLNDPGSDRHDGCGREYCVPAAALAVARRVLGETTTTTGAQTDSLRDRIRRAVCEAEGFAWDTDMLEPDEYGEVADAVMAVLPTGGDRAAVLREAADDLTALAAPDSERGAGVRWAADHLRHKADQAQQNVGGEAHPAQHRWAAELHDPLADEWIPGTRYLLRDRAVNDLEHARKIAPKWKDGTPTERRLVRETTTYTVEQPTPAVTEEATR